MSWTAAPRQALADATSHVSLAERRAIDKEAANREPDSTVRSAGVVGCGTMGAGIATCLANAGIPVSVIEADAHAVQAGLSKIRAAYTRSEVKGRLTPDEAGRRIALITSSTDFAMLADADVVVEAVPEEFELKESVFRTLDAVCRPDAILATNTSSLDVNELARRSQHPPRVAGMHFFSPANVMALVEIIRSDMASDATISAVRRLARRLGKVPVVVGVCEGFVGNRMLFAYRRQTDFLLEEGALPSQIDEALRRFGFAMGPYEAADLAGLDISWRIRKRQAPTRPTGVRYSPIADRLCELGRFGQKTGAGWYRYEAGGRMPLSDPAVEDIIVQTSKQLGIPRRDVSSDEIVERSLSALVNEGALVLEEGVAGDAADIDVIWVNGYGFPRRLGGPMFWADSVGLQPISAEVQRLYREQGSLVRPSALLRDLARRGARFTALATPDRDALAGTQGWTA